MSVPWQRTPAEDPYPACKAEVEKQAVTSVGRGYAVTDCACGKQETLTAKAEKDLRHPAKAHFTMNQERKWYAPLTDAVTDVQKAGRVCIFAGYELRWA